jgi:integrase/recombinase XerD
MKSVTSNALGRVVSKYFQDYLPTLRGMSINTIRSYRDALVLYLTYVSSKSETKYEKLDLDAFSRDQVIGFLADLEKSRKCSISTRNNRLAAIHTFARFAVSAAPEYLAEFQAIIALPFKRGAQRVPVEFLTSSEVDALLELPKAASEDDQRDVALFALMLNTGARVQEICDLKVSDIRVEKPYQVRLKGKGGRERNCPIWKRTADRIKRMLSQSMWSTEPDQPLFVNRRGEGLTRFGVYYLLRKRIEDCSNDIDESRGRRIHPHVLRHTTAVHMLKAGVDFATISQWLGHASLNTTLGYARVDMDIKRRALAQVFPDAPAAPRGGGMPNTHVVDWLRRI